MLNQQAAIIIDRAYDGYSAALTAFGYVCSALPRGYLANANGASDAYFACQYIADILNNGALGAEPLAQKLPYWLLAMSRAVSPKTVAIANGYVAYKWSGSGILVPPGGFPLNPSGSAGTRLVTPTNTLLWGFPGGALPVGYTEQLGKQAFLTIAQFMSNKGLENKMVSLDDKTQFDTNVSTYCVQRGITGWGPFGGGGIDLLLDHEVPIHSPLLGTWNTPATNPINTLSGRGGQRTSKTAGTPIMIGAGLSSIFQARHWSTKIKPYIKFYDFLEFGQVLAYFCQGLLTRLASDNISQSTISDPLAYQCPLSLQEVLLLLRNEMMYLFSSTQAACQCITPRNQNANMFTTFSAGTNSCSVGSVNMQLPLAFVENIKSAACQMGITKGRSVRYWLPVLGKYDGVSLSQSDYQVDFTVLGEVTTVPVFATPSAKTVSTKGEQVAAEPIFNLIDGTSGGTSYFINDTKRLGELVVHWNKWIANLSAYSSSLTTVTNDKGMVVIGVPTKTRHWNQPSEAGLARAKAFVDPRMSKSNGFGTVYASQEAVAVTGYSELLPGTDIFFRSFVLPINYIGPAENDRSETDFQRYRGLYEETHTIVNSSTGDAAKTLESIHYTFAEQLTKGKAAPITEMDQQIEELSKHGQAGILSTLARTVGGAVFGPGVGNVLGTIGDAIGV